MELDKTPGRDADCEAAQADEYACSDCEHYLECFGEHPWDAAIQEYERSRGV
jgi:hypothetical protein